MSDDNQEEPTFSIQQLAHMWRVGTQKLREMNRRGILRPIRLVRIVRYTREEIRRYEDEHAYSPEQEEEENKQTDGSEYE